MTYEIVQDGRIDLNGIRFEVPPGATENEVAEAAAEAVMPNISYGWCQVSEEELAEESEKKQQKKRSR